MSEGPRAESANDHWNQHAVNWRHFDSPLRPIEEDIRWFEQALPASGSVKRRKALLLGVTPELACMQRPEQLDLYAVDQCVSMIRNVWPQSEYERSSVFCGDWFRIPFPDHSLDAVLGDGVLVFFPFVGVSASGGKALLTEIKRVLHPAGRLLLRVFIRPDNNESLEAIHSDLFAGRIGSFHAYKWRLAMAMHGNISDGVRPAEVWRKWREFVPDSSVLAKTTGWHENAIATIEAYRDSSAVYYFPTMNELREMLGHEFAIVDSYISGYELGERCPLLALQPKS